MKNLKLTISEIELNVFYPDTSSEPSKAELTDIVANRVEKYNHMSINKMEMNFSDEFVDVKCSFNPTPFNRIRRITGYLVGDMSRFNDAKAAEVRDRKKHLSAADTMRLRDTDADGRPDFIDSDGYSKVSDLYFKQINADQYENIRAVNQNLLKECRSTPDGDFILKVSYNQKNELEKLLSNSQNSIKPPSPLTKKY